MIPMVIGYNLTKLVSNLAAGKKPLSLIIVVSEAEPFSCNGRERVDR